MRRGAGRTALAVLRRLETAEGAVSGEALSHELAVSRMAISKAVAHLRALGCEVDSAPHRGYRLVRGTDQPVAFAVEPLLRTAFLGRAWVFEFQLQSTNRTAAELAAAGAVSGLVVAADAQTAGRGRLGRQWHSPAGRNLYVSVLLRPDVGAVRVPQISLLVALALRRALLGLCPALPVGVKWPNDLWIGGRKLAGVLCEMDAEVDRVHHVVVGLGLNVNPSADEWPEALAGRATSLRIEAGHAWSRPQVLAAFLNAFEPLLAEWEAAADLGPFVGELDQASVLRGRRIRVECGQRTVAGVAAGIAADGRLRLRTDGGDELLLSSGDAHLLSGGSPGTGHEG